MKFVVAGPTATEDLEAAAQTFGFVPSLLGVLTEVPIAPRARVVDAMSLPVPYPVRCSEIWGGNGNADLDVCTNGINASVYSLPCGSEVQQLLRLILPNCAEKSGLSDPFAEAVPSFFDFLRRERGLREATLVQYRHYLRRLQDYLQRIGRPLLPDLLLATVSTFITDSGATIDKRSVQSLCSILKVFFRYLYRVGLMTRDLSKAIESPRRYSLASTRVTARDSDLR